MIRRTLPALAAATAITAISAAAYAAEPVLLKYGDPGPPTASIHVHVIEPWSKRVMAQSDGAVNVRVYVGNTLVSMRNTYDRVLNGVADLAFCILGPVSTLFPQTLVATLPFIAENAHEAGLALQRMYDKGIISGEWQKVKPVAFGIFANLTYHTVPRVDKLEDLKGLKISVQDRTAGKTLEALGGVPISLPITEVYQALQRGTIQGAAIGWPATVDFKLTDIVHHHLRESLGGAAAIMIMNKNSYARLSGKAKQVIDANIGTGYTNLFNKTIDDTEHENVEKVAHKMPGQELHKLAPAEEAIWKKRIEPVIAAYIHNTPNGQKVFDAFQKEVAAIRSGS